MRFIVERKIMLGYCRSFVRFVPETSPIADLTGILIEADENKGSVLLTATNLEVTVQYAVGASVAEGGRMVLNAALLAQMMQLLGEDLVTFCTAPEGNIVEVRSGAAQYVLPCLSGAHYPKPEVPLPENTVRVAGLDRLAKQTILAAKKKSDKMGDMLTNIKLEIYPTAVHAIGSDGVRLALVRYRQEGNGQLSLLIPVSSLSLLAGIAGENVLDVGISKNTLVFTGPGFVFSTLTMSGAYFDAGTVLKSIRTEYDALVNSADFRAAAEILETVADTRSLAHLTLHGDGISLECEGELGKSHTHADAVVYTPTPAEGFYYGAAYLLHVLRHMDGNIRLSIDKMGVMLLKNTDQFYLLTPRRPLKKAPAEKKPAAKTKKEKKTKPAKAA